MESVKTYSRIDRNKIGVQSNWQVIRAEGLIAWWKLRLQGASPKTAWMPIKS